MWLGSREASAVPYSLRSLQTSTFPPHAHFARQSDARARTLSAFVELRFLPAAIMGAWFFDPLTPPLRAAYLAVGDGEAEMERRRWVILEDVC